VTLKRALIGTRSSLTYKVDQITHRFAYLLQRFQVMFQQGIQKSLNLHLVCARSIKKLSILRK